MTLNATELVLPNMITNLYDWTCVHVTGLITYKAELTHPIMTNNLSLTLLTNSLCDYVTVTWLFSVSQWINFSQIVSPK